MWRYILFLYRNSSNHWANRWFCREYYGSRNMARNDFPSIDTRFIRETFLSDQFDRNFANPCIPPTDISRVSCWCDNYIRGVHGTRREGKTLYRGRACENAVRDSATRRSRKCAFLFFFFKKRTQFVVFIFWKNWRGRFLRWTKVFLVKSRFLNSSQLKIWWYQS